jgi:ribosomal protein S18 acetylase RimI-like enzyme
MNANVPASLKFRRMHPGDTEVVLTLGKSSLTYIDLASSEPDPHDYNSSYIMSGLTYEEFDPVGPGSPQSLNIVAEIDKKVIGFVLAYTRYIGIPIIKICILHAIVVDPDYHGQGISTRLVSQLQNHCKEEDIKVMRILVRPNDNRLKNYLGSLGFHQNNVLVFDKFSGD